MSSSEGDYEVFLSFRGSDTRKNFTDVLHKAMVDAKLRVFLDDKAIEIGDEIYATIDAALKNSKICIPIFSPNFAQSKNCLREVTKMVELKNIIVPIFCCVESDDVKLKTPRYYNMLRVHEMTGEYEDEVQKWKKALKHVASFKGKKVDEHTSYTQICGEIVDEVLSKLSRMRRGRNSDEIMAQSVPIPGLGAPVTVLGQDFVAPYPIQLDIVRKAMTLEHGSFNVTDSNNTNIFKVNGSIITMHDRRELVDASGRTLVTMLKKVASLHGKWKGFRGESTDEKDLVFTVKRSKALRLETKLAYVYLGQNPNKDVCDYIIEGSRSAPTSVIYAANTTRIVAQIRKKVRFGVTVYPNIDPAFIVALGVILPKSIHSGIT